MPTLNAASITACRTFLSRYLIGYHQELSSSAARKDRDVQELARIADMIAAAVGANTDGINSTAAHASPIPAVAVPAHALVRIDKGRADAVTVPVIASLPQTVAADL